MAIALDGSVIATGSGSSLAFPGLTTANANDVIIVYVENNNGAPVTVTSPNLGSFTQRAFGGVTNFELYEFYAIASSILSSEVITIHFGGTAAFIAGIAFGISGANTSSPFDSDASLPATGATSPLTINTTSANTMVIGGFRMTSPSEGSGFTPISAANFILAEYAVFSSPQSGLSVGTGNDSGVNGSIADAIVAAGAAAAPFGWKAPVVSMFRR